MIVSTRVFFILLLPLLMQGAPSGTDSGNRNQNTSPQSPQAANALPDYINSLSPTDLLKETDGRLRAAVLPVGTTYGIEGIIDAPIPTGNYYRVPSMVVLRTPRRSIPRLKRTRIVRVRQPVDRSHIVAIHRSSEVPVLPLNPLLHKFPLSTSNNNLFNALTLPKGSTYRVHSDTNDIPIDLDKYIQLPPTAVVTAPVLGALGKQSNRVVCSVQYIGIQTLEGYKKDCIESYRRKCKRPGIDGIGDDTYVNRCLKNMWIHVVFSKGPIEFRELRLLGTR